MNKFLSLDLSIHRVCTVIFILAVFGVGQLYSYGTVLKKCVGVHKNGYIISVNRIMKQKRLREVLWFSSLPSGDSTPNPI